ncbi:MAG: hypothetical protein ACXVB1_18235, partial [Pseudobdellovibrionaceae bacterium]
KTNNNIYLDEIDLDNSLELSTWVQSSGFSFEELRLIQPQYRYRPLFEDPLLEAASLGKIKDLKKIKIDEFAKYNWRSKKERLTEALWTAIVRKSNSGDFKGIIEYLIALGADPNDRSFNRMSMMLWSTPEVKKILLAKGAHLTEQEKLIEAIHGGKVDAVQEILKDPNIKFYDHSFKKESKDVQPQAYQRGGQLKYQSPLIASLKDLCREFTASPKTVRRDLEGIRKKERECLKELENFQSGPSFNNDSVTILKLLLDSGHIDLDQELEILNNTPPQITYQSKIESLFQNSSNLKADVLIYIVRKFQDKLVLADWLYLVKIYSEISISIRSDGNIKSNASLIQTKRDYEHLRELILKSKIWQTELGLAMTEESQFADFFYAYASKPYDLQESKNSDLKCQPYEYFSRCYSLKHRPRMDALEALIKNGGTLFGCNHDIVEMALQNDDFEMARKIVNKFNYPKDKADKLKTKFPKFSIQ